MATGMFINSGHFLSIARQAYERAKAAAKHDRSHTTGEPLIAIIFAAAAGEAFINELAEQASHPSPPDMEPKPACISSLASVLSEVDIARGTTNLKYHLGKLILAGRGFDKGANPFQDFSVLMELRNSLMHLKFDRIVSVRINETRVRYPEVVARLRSRNILTQFENENTIASWVQLVSTPAVARWACNATAAIVTDVVESIPNSWLRESADLFYGKSSVFTLVA